VPLRRLDSFASEIQVFVSVFIVVAIVIFLKPTAPFQPHTLFPFNPPHPPLYHSSSPPRTHCQPPLTPPLNPPLNPPLHPCQQDGSVILLKVDAEGAEGRIFTGAHRLLQAVDLVLFEVGEPWYRTPSVWNVRDAAMFWARNEFLAFRLGVDKLFRWLAIYFWK